MVLPLLGLKLSISSSQGFYKKIASLEIEVDEIEVKSLVGLESSLNSDNLMV